MTQRSAVYHDMLISNRARLLAPAALATAFMLRQSFAAAQPPTEVEALLESSVSSSA